MALRVPSLAAGVVRMSRFRKKPVVIEAHQWQDDMTADVGDWIIRGVAGEFYPCKPDIFAATYDSVA